jgi:hypothetical protein
MPDGQIRELPFRDGALASSHRAKKDSFSRTVPSAGRCLRFRARCHLARRGPHLALGSIPPSPLLHHRRWDPDRMIPPGQPFRRDPMQAPEGRCFGVWPDPEVFLILPVGFNSPTLS